MKKLVKCLYCSVYGSEPICEHCGAPTNFRWYEEKPIKGKEYNVLVIDEASTVDWKKLLTYWKI